MSLPLWAVLVLALLAFATVSLAKTYPQIDVEHIDQVWEAHIIKYNIKFRNDTTRQWRFETFKDNVKFINEENAKGLSYELGLGPHSHLSYDEFVRRKTGRNPIQLFSGKRSVEEAEAVLDASDLQRIPKRFDWRNKTGIIGPVRNQVVPQYCGSCWAHASLGVLESMWALKHGNLPSLAPQQLVDCAPAPCHQCHYGSVTGAYQYLLRNGGAHTEASYPYTAVAGTCQVFNGSIGANVLLNETTGKAYQLLPKNETLLRAYLSKHGPFVATLNATKQVQHWKGGILMDSTCAGKSNHYIQIIGYDTINGTPVWIGKNSWGTGWNGAMKGFFYIQRNVPNACGLYGELVAPYVA
jgi:cathepsin F